MNLPVDYLVIVQVLETKNDTPGIEHTSWLTEHICVDVHHKVASASILHHEDSMLLKTHIITDTVAVSGVESTSQSQGLARSRSLNFEGNSDSG